MKHNFGAGVVVGFARGKMNSKLAASGAAFDPLSAFHRAELSRAPEAKFIGAALDASHFHFQPVVRSIPGFGQHTQAAAFRAQRRQGSRNAHSEVVEHGDVQLVGAASERKLYLQMLVRRALGDTVRDQVAAHFHRDDFSRGAERRRKFQRAIARAAAIRIQRDRFFGAVIAKVDGAPSDVNILHREVRPVCRNMRRECKQMRSASIDNPNIPRSSGLMTMAADQIWCGELVESGWY